MISIITCFDITQDVEITNIELSANMTQKKPDLELLCDVVMIEPRLSEMFLLRETTIPISMKVKVFYI